MEPGMLPGTTGPQAGGSWESRGPPPQRKGGAAAGPPRGGGERGETAAAADASASSPKCWVHGRGALLPAPGQGAPPQPRTRPPHHPSGVTGREVLCD
eukprot:gene24992-biopygen19467